MTGNVNKRKLLIWIPIAAILINGAAYLIVSSLRGSPSVEPPNAVAKLTVGRPAADTTSDRKHVTGGDDQEVEARALARRSAGLSALDAGEYERALIDFTEARSLLGDKANVTELLRVTEDLRAKRDRQAASVPPRPAHVAAAPSPPPPRPLSRPAVGRRLAVRETPIPVVEAAPSPPPPMPPPPAGGLLIVSTTPRGLLVHVDDAAVDLTPMRTKVKPGLHRVALFDGDRKVYEASVEVKDGGTATLVKDLPVEMAVEMAPSRETAPPPPPAPATRAEAQPRTMALRAPVPQRPRPAPQTAPASSAGDDTGALQITSPGLYGVVWVNGHPRGYPPLEVSDLAGGPTKVEVRVNGIEKRTATVVVAPGRTTNVDLR
jgi:hypothetical protein